MATPIRTERLERDGSEILSITLDRAEKRNALTPEMLDEVGRAAREADAGVVGAALLRGEGPMFCAGFDLSLCRDDPDAMKALLRALSGAIHALRACPLPVIACAHSGAIAGGCALLTGCDLVITNDDARLGYPVLRLGVSPAVTTPLLERAAGHASTRERTLDPALVSGKRGARLGLATESLRTPEDAAARAEERAFAIAAKPRSGVRATKRWLNTLDHPDLDAELDRALAASVALAGSEEERALLTAMWSARQGGDNR